MRKLLFLLPVILLLFNQRDNSVLLNSERVTAFADTFHVSLAAPTGRLFSIGSTLATSRELSAATDSGTGFYLGDSKNTAGNFTFFYGFISFEIPALSSIDSVCVVMDGALSKKAASPVDSVFTFYSASAIGSTLERTDVSKIDGWVSGNNAWTGTPLTDEWNSSTYTTGWNKFIGNAALRDTLLAHSGETFTMVAMAIRDHLNTYNPATTDSLYYQMTNTAGTTAPFLFISGTPATPNDNDGSRGLIGGDISEGRTW